MQTFAVRTRARTQMLDITEDVRDALAKEGVASGLCTVFVPHTTAGVTINENADPSVPRDILSELNRTIPFDGDYAHMEGNSAAHIKAGLMGASAHVIVEGGRLQLGTWQAIFFCEFDGPRQRQVWVSVK